MAMYENGLPVPYLPLQLGNKYDQALPDPSLCMWSRLVLQSGTWCNSIVVLNASGNYALIVHCYSILSFSKIPSVYYSQNELIIFSKIFTF